MANKSVDAGHLRVLTRGTFGSLGPSTVRPAAIAQAQATKEVQRAGIAHAKANGGPHTYKGRKQSYNRKQFESAQAMLHKSTGDGEVARIAGLTRQTVYRIKDDPAAAGAVLATWGM